MSSTSIRRARSYSYKDIWSRTSRLEGEYKQFVELFKEVSESTKQLEKAEDVIDMNCKEYFLNGFDHSEKDIEMTFEEKMSLFQKNFRRKTGNHNVCLLFRDIRVAFANCIASEESGITLITNAKMIIDREKTPNRISDEDFKIVSPHDNSPINNMHQTNTDSEYFWIKKESGSIPPLYELKLNSPFGLHSSNPENTYEFYPVMTNLGVLEAIEFKQYETSNTTGCYTHCTYNFNDPALGDGAVISKFVFETYFKPYLSQMYPNYIATCSLRLGDGIDRRMVFLESGACYSIACPCFAEQLS